MAERMRVFAFVKSYTWDNGKPSVLPEEKEQVQDTSMGCWRLDHQEDMPTKQWRGCFLTWDPAHTCSFLGEEVASEQLQTSGLKDFPLLQGLSGLESLHQNQGDEEERGTSFQGMVDRTPTEGRLYSTWEDLGGKSGTVYIRQYTGTD